MAINELYYAFNPWWEGKDFDAGIPRDEYINKLGDFFSRKQINVVIGSRRVGKTTLLKQMLKQVLKSGLSANQIFYLSLDHPQLLTLPISEHLRNFRKLFMHDRDKKLLLFLDEVQESPNWEGELKSIYDLENVKIVCTGSTSSLIKSQGGKLTGRQIITILYPLSFKEFISFRKEVLSAAEEYKYEKILEDYLQIGGYPEYVLNPSMDYLANLLEDIIARDLVRVFRVRRANLLKDIFRILAASVGLHVSFNKVANTVGAAVDTVKEYMGYFESAFLIKTLEKWSTSYKERIYAAKKIYLLDTGFKTMITGKGDSGAKAENLVFMQILRGNQSCGYFYVNQKEVDFVVGGYTGNSLPVEVKYDSEFDWRSKKFSGLKLFLESYPGTKEAVVVTKDVETEVKAGGTIIRAIPLWKFLLNPVD